MNIELAEQLHHERRVVLDMSQLLGPPGISVYISENGYFGFEVVDLKNRSLRVDGVPFNEVVGKPIYVECLVDPSQDGHSTLSFYMNGERLVSNTFEAHLVDETIEVINSIGTDVRGLHACKFSIGVLAVYQSLTKESRAQMTEYMLYRLNGNGPDEATS